jgi:hypothetical protein
MSKPKHAGFVACSAARRNCSPLVAPIQLGMYAPRPPVRLALHVLCGDRYAQHCFFLEASLQIF